MAAAALASAWPASAQAHLVQSGLGPVYDGIAHLLLSADDLLLLLAAAMLAGSGGAAVARRTLLVLPLAWLAGGLVGWAVPVAPVAWATTPGLVVLGVLVASGRRLAPASAAALTAAFGAWHGWLNGIAIAGTGQETLAMFGIAAAVGTLATLVAAWVVSLRSAAARIAVRVLGSWVAAVGLLMLGWSLRAG
jgi:hydrogenase/urease accessory protein HupE